MQSPYLASRTFGPRPTHYLAHTSPYQRQHPQYPPPEQETAASVYWNGSAPAHPASSHGVSASPNHPQELPSSLPLHAPSFSNYPPASSAASGASPPPPPPPPPLLQPGANHQSISSHGFPSHLPPSRYDSSTPLHQSGHFQSHPHATPLSAVPIPQPQQAPSFTPFSQPGAYTQQPVHGSPSPPSVPVTQHLMPEYAAPSISGSLLAPPQGYGQVPLQPNVPVAFQVPSQYGHSSSSTPPMGFVQPENPPPSVMYGENARYTSKFQTSGRKKALLIGINYPGTNLALQGCVRDAGFMYFLLRTKFGFQDSDFWVLTDEPCEISNNVATARPTRENILRGMRWLVEGAQQGDSLFFHFSGHGSQIKDTSGDEADGLDETLVPEDFREKGEIVDDEIHEILVRNLPKGVRLTAVVDCCHSGTVFDLPFIHDGAGFGAGITIDGPLPSNPSAKDEEDAAAMMGTFSVISKFVGMIRAKRKKYNHALSKEQNKRPYPNPNPDTGEVVLFSGCQDCEKSADTINFAGVPTGAMTYCFVQAIERGSESDWRGYTYRSLLHTMRAKLREQRLPQIPQFSSSHQFDLSSPFAI